MSSSSKLGLLDVDSFIASHKHIEITLFKRYKAFCIQIVTLLNTREQEIYFDLLKLIASSASCGRIQHDP